MALNYKLLYRNISPFCEPLSINLSYECLHCIFVRIFLLFYRGFRLYFNRIFYCILYEFSYEFYTAFDTNFYCIFVRISTVFYMNFSTVFSYEFLCFIRSFTLVISYEFFSSFFAQIDYHTVYIDLCLYPWNNESDCNIRIFGCKTHLTMSLIVLFFTISLTCTFTVNCSVIATNYCPMYFLMKIVLCNKFVGEVPWNSASCSFICTRKIKTPFADGGLC